jgi:hypothetical protein
MAQLLRLLGEFDWYQSPAPRAFAPRSDAQRGAESPISDLDLARTTRANLLVVGDDDIVAGIMTSLWPSLATPIAVRQRGDRLRLSPTSPPASTIVIYDVDTLTRHQQRRLHHWIAVNGRTQIVSTASKSLWPMLQAGAFHEALYYRLNVLMLDPTSLVGR